MPALSLAVPAAIAGAAYLNARFSIVQDLWGISRSFQFQAELDAIEKADRLNLFYRFEELAKLPAFTNQPFLILPNDDDNVPPTEFTYAQAYDIVLRYARWLKEDRGVQKNEIIAMDFKNKPQFIWIWFALWSLGAVPAFINSNLADTAFVHCAKISTTRLLLVDADIQHILTSEATSALTTPDEKGHAVEIIVFDAALEARIRATQPFRAPNEARSGALQKTPAILIYTSGTTGLPKAAKVNWAKPRSGTHVFSALLALQSTDRYLTAMPLYHSSASVLGVCQVLGPGAAIIVAPRFSPRLQMKYATDTKATVMQYIGEMCRYLVTSPPTPYDRTHKLRLAFGNGMRPDVWQKFIDRFNIPVVCEFYGATEAPGASFVYSRNGFYRGAIGRAGWLARTLVGGQQALIRHDTSTDEPWRDPKTGLCARVATNEPGELIYLIDRANIADKFQGYLGNSKASDGKILFDVFKKGDAFYRSGDLIRRDGDGHLWFVDRIGDTFRWKGENVSTAEVAEVLGSHTALREANVYGVTLPNHDGRAGCAAIGLAEGQHSGPGLPASLARDLATLAKKRLPKYAVPLFLRVVREIDVTGTFKHQKVALRNAGVDPEKTDGDELYWLPSSTADTYEPFGKREWDRIAGGSAKL